VRFPAWRDDPSDSNLFVGFKPEVRLRRIEGFEPGAQSRRKRREANPPQADLRWLLVVVDTIHALVKV